MRKFLWKGIKKLKQMTVDVEKVLMRIKWSHMDQERNPKWDMQKRKDC